MVKGLALHKIHHTLRLHLCPLVGGGITSLARGNLSNEEVAPVTFISSFYLPLSMVTPMLRISKCDLLLFEMG